MSSKLRLNEKYVVDYIIEKLNLNRSELKRFDNAKYHHNSSYRHALLILKHGILSLERLQKKGIVNYTDEQMKILSDTDSHINGISGISLSVQGLNDLYEGEEEYDSSCHDYIDFIISDNVNAKRMTNHYGNEYVTFSDILLNDIKSLDFRIIKLIKEKYNNGNLDNFYEELIYKYNMVLYTAKEIKKRNLKIQMREMSEEEINLDIESLSKLPILEIK